MKWWVCPIITTIIIRVENWIIVPPAEVDYAFTYLLCRRNIVSTVSLGCKLDLKTIALKARNAEYNPKVSWTCGSILLWKYSHLYCLLSASVLPL